MKAGLKEQDDISCCRLPIEDDDAILNIQENPYMQYLIGLHEFTQIAPFA